MIKIITESNSSQSNKLASILESVLDEEFANYYNKSIDIICTEDMIKIKNPKGEERLFKVKSEQKTVYTLSEVELGDICMSGSGGNKDEFIKDSVDTVFEIMTEIK